MNIEQIAAEMGVDKNAMQDLLNYLMKNIKRTPENMEAFLANPAEIIKQGIEAWMKSSQDFFNELLENKTERAQKYRADIAHSVWVEGRKKQGLPV